MKKNPEFEYQKSIVYMMGLFRCVLAQVLRDYVGGEAISSAKAQREAIEWLFDPAFSSERDEIFAKACISEIAVKDIVRRGDKKTIRDVATLLYMGCENLETEIPHGSYGIGKRSKRTLSSRVRKTPRRLYSPT